MQASLCVFTSFFNANLKKKNSKACDVSLSTNYDFLFFIFKNLELLVASLRWHGKLEITIMHLYLMRWFINGVLFLGEIAYIQL